MKYGICCLIPAIEIVPPFSLLKRLPDFHESVRERYDSIAFTGQSGLGVKELFSKASIDPEGSRSWLRISDEVKARLHPKEGRI